MSETNELSRPPFRMHLGRRYGKGDYEYYEPALLTDEEREKAITCLSGAEQGWLKRSMRELLVTFGNEPTKIGSLITAAGEPEITRLSLWGMRSAHYRWIQHNIDLRVAQGQITEGAWLPRKDPEAIRIIQVWRVRSRFRRDSYN